MERKTVLKSILCFLLIFFPLLFLIYPGLQHRTNSTTSRNNWFNSSLGYYMSSIASATKVDLCSFPLLQQANEKAVSTTGTWLNNSRGEIITFKSNLCGFRYNLTWPVTKINDCFAKFEKIRYIVVLGDSNGKRYGKALQDFFIAHQYHCRTVKSATMSTNDTIAYYVTRSIKKESIRFVKRDCSGCNNILSQCSTVSGKNITAPSHTVYIEYLAMEFTLDLEVTSWRPSRCGPQGNVCISSSSSQEFLFREYLQGDAAPSLSTPDLVLVFGNSHDKVRMKLTDFHRSIRYVMDLADELLPQKTKILWLSKPYESAAHKKAEWKNARFENLTANDWIHQSNQLLFKELKQRIGRSRRNLSFFDLFSLGKPIANLIGLDGVHMKPVWYQHIISNILQTFCSKYI